MDEGVASLLVVDYLGHHFALLVVLGVLQPIAGVHSLVGIGHLPWIHNLSFLGLVRYAIVYLSDQMVIVLILLLDHRLPSVYLRLGILRTQHRLHLVEQPTLAWCLLLGCSRVASSACTVLHIVC